MIGAALALNRRILALAPVKVLHDAVGYLFISGRDSPFTNGKVGSVASDGLRQADVRSCNHGQYFVGGEFAHVKSKCKDKVVNVHFKGNHGFFDARRETGPEIVNRAEVGQ